MNLSFKKEPPFVGGCASPFIEQGGGFTGEREIVWMLQSLDAHADEEWIMVGAHNTVDVTVECQVHVGGCVVFFRKGWRQYLQNTAGCLEACEESHHVYRVQ